MYPSEFQDDPKYTQIFRKHGFNNGRMICGSKSRYREMYPDNKVIFNANIIIESIGKVFYGDLDITLDYINLEKVSDELGEPLYILREMDARFENENLPINEFIKRAVVKI